MIQAGDKVMLVWGCCEYTRGYIGWVGVVERTCAWPCEAMHTCCGLLDAPNTQQAWVEIERRGVIPCSWLIKMPDDTTELTERELEEVAAHG